MMHHNVHLVLRSRVQSPKFSKLDVGQQTGGSLKGQNVMERLCWKPMVNVNNAFRKFPD